MTIDANHISFDAVLRKQADEICKQYPVKRAALLPVLHLIQNQYCTFLNLHQKNHYTLTVS